jgi:phospholipid/cholesterol/gamma-HCH transport system permease protein
MQWIGRIGAQIQGKLAAFGDFWIFSLRVLQWLGPGVLRRRTRRLLMPEFQEVGSRSVQVVMITGFFVGSVLAVQAYAQFKDVGMESRMGVLVNLSVVRELGPVLAGVMLAGRVGGAFTAELGTMNVTEQIEALRSMGAAPIRYLVVPRFLACLLLTPLLTIYCDVTGSFAGWLITVPLYGVPSEPYWYYVAESIETWDMFIGLIKSLFFGGAIALIGCYKGFRCGHGAEGVGRACNDSFVASFIAILVMNFFISYLMQEIYRSVWGFHPLL